MEQFIGFLVKQNMIVKMGSSPISESLKKYQKKVGDLSKDLGNMRSMKRLDAIHELHQVRDLMVMMGDALGSLKKIHTIRFLSGQHKGGWIGYSLNKMDYFFYISYENPEIVIFDTYSFKIDESKFDGSVGKTWSEGKRLRWMNELNLVSDDLDFFSETKESQMGILKDFLKQSYSYLQKIKA